MNRPKIALKQDIYRVKDSSHSPKPKSKSPVVSRISNPTKNYVINLNDMFQKVCCPNCRYLFKIIREQKIFQVPPTKSSVSNAAFQTNQTMIEWDILKSQLQKLRRQNPSKVQMSIKQFTVEKIKDVGQFEEKEKSYLSRSEVSIKGQLRMTSRNLAQKQQKSGSSKKNMSSFKNEYLPKGNLEQQQMDRYRAYLNEKLVGQLLDKFHMGRSQQELAEFCEHLPRSAEIPSYCKMLLKEING